MKKEIGAAVTAAIIAFSGTPHAHAEESYQVSTKQEYNTSNLAKEAVRGSGIYSLHNADGQEVLADFSQTEGFTPDENLIISNYNAYLLSEVPPEISRNFQGYLNSPENPLAGYTDGINDYNQYGEHKSGPQVPAYSWMIHSGLIVDIPGIGRVEGGQGRMASILIINCTDKVYRFPTESVEVQAGFEGWGRVWDANPNSNKVFETERKLTEHYCTRFGEGIPEVGFIGQTDQGERNADEATLVSVLYLQNGYNADGTPRYQFQLIRSETVPTI